MLSSWLDVAIENSIARMAFLDIEKDELSRETYENPKHLQLSMKLFSTLFCAFLFCAHAFAGSDQNAFHPGEIWNDNNGVHINAHGGGILFDKGVYYWFGEHKIAGTEGNNAHVGVHCYSSKDLYNWKDEGVALKVSDKAGHPIEKGCILERPKVIYNPATRKYVMWFHLELKGRGYGAAQSGVAVATKVTGPYKFLYAGRANPDCWPQNFPKERQNLETAPKPVQLGGSWFPEEMDPAAFMFRDFKSGQMARDMTLFVDDDGKAYHIFASEENGTLQIAELDGTFTKHSGKYWRAFEGRFMEAPAICKRKGKYYLIMSGCTGWAPNSARSAVAEKITGPWTELKNPCIGKDSGSTFGAQSTYILKIQNKQDSYIFMSDRWRPNDAIDGRYVWLPMKWHGDQIQLEWKDSWKY